MPWREISRGLNLSSEGWEGKEPRRLKPQGPGGICDTLRAHRPIVVELHRNGRTSEWTLERTNEHMTEDMDLFVFLYFLLFVWFCFVISSATINAPTVQNAINPWRVDHRRMTEGMNEWPKEGTNEQMNIEAWLEHNRKICRQFGPTPKNTFPSEFWGLGERFGEGFDGSGHKSPADSYWNLLGRSIANFRNYLKAWFIFMEIHWNLIET